MARTVQGKNVTLRLKNDVDGLYYPTFCATSCEISYTFELVKKTSPGAGRWAKYRPRGLDGTITAEGVTQIIPLEAVWTVFGILEKAVRGDYLDVQLEFLDGDGNVKTLSATTLASGINISAGSDGFSQDTLDLQMTGPSDVFNAIVPSETGGGGGIIPGGGGGIPPDEGGGGIGGGIAGIVKVGRHTGSATWTDSDTAGGSLLMAFREDPLEIITSGTPTPTQLKWNATTGDFAISSPLDAGEAIYYLYVKP